MKTYFPLLLVLLLFPASLWSQAPTSKSPPDYVVTAGEFPHPGLIAYKAGMKFSQAIEAAYGGDYNEYAKVRTIYLIRCGKKEEIDLKFLRTDPSNEPMLQPWDIIYLPPAFF